MVSLCSTEVIPASTPCASLAVFKFRECGKRQQVWDIEPNAGIMCAEHLREVSAARNSMTLTLAT